MMRFAKSNAALRRGKASCLGLKAHRSEKKSREFTLDVNSRLFSFKCDGDGDLSEIVRFLVIPTRILKAYLSDRRRFRRGIRFSELFERIRQSVRLERLDDEVGSAQLKGIFENILLA